MSKVHYRDLEFNKKYLFQIHETAVLVTLMKNVSNDYIEFITDAGDIHYTTTNEDGYVLRLIKL